MQSKIRATCRMIVGDMKKQITKPIERYKAESKCIKYKKNLTKPIARYKDESKFIKSIL